MARSRMRRPSIRRAACLFDSSCVSAVAAGGLAVSGHDRQSRHENPQAAQAKWPHPVIAICVVVTCARRSLRTPAFIPFLMASFDLVGRRQQMESTPTWFQHGKSEP